MSQSSSQNIGQSRRRRRRSPKITGETVRMLRWLGWAFVGFGGGYAALVVFWIVKDPRW
jgi:hypothetical protein